MKNYIEYAKHVNAQQDVTTWIETHLAAHLAKNTVEQSEVEHIIDYMASDKRPSDYFY